MEECSCLAARIETVVVFPVAHTASLQAAGNLSALNRPVRTQTIHGDALPACGSRISSSLEPVFANLGHVCITVSGGFLDEILEP